MRNDALAPTLTRHGDHGLDHGHARDSRHEDVRRTNTKIDTRHFWIGELAKLDEHITACGQRDVSLSKEPPEPAVSLARSSLGSLPGRRARVPLLG